MEHTLTLPSPWSLIYYFKNLGLSQWQAVLKYKYWLLVWVEHSVPIFGHGSLKCVPTNKNDLTGVDLKQARNSVSACEVGAHIYVPSAWDPA